MCLVDRVEDMRVCETDMNDLTENLGVLGAAVPGRCSNTIDLCIERLGSRELVHLGREEKRLMSSTTCSRQCLCTQSLEEKSPRDQPTSQLVQRGHICH